MIFDISHPHDLRLQLDKPSLTAEEIDVFLDDADADSGLKEGLLADVEPQGYQRREAAK